MNFEFDTKKYLKKLKNNEKQYFHTFFSNENLAAGILLLQPGEEDLQTPHDSDEMYYVLYGDGFLKIKKNDYSLSEGKSYYVPKNTDHFFFGNTEELAVLYFFGGPDS